MNEFVLAAAVISSPVVTAKARSALPDVPVVPAIPSGRRRQRTRMAMAQTLRAVAGRVEPVAEHC